MMKIKVTQSLVMVLDYIFVLYFEYEGERYSYVYILLTENNEVWATDPGAERGSGAGQPAPQTAAGGTRTSPWGGEAENASRTREWG